MDDKILDIDAFDSVWFKDCFHMALIPVVNQLNGNADCVLFNQIFTYSYDSAALSISAHNFENLYSLLSQNNVTILPQVSVEDVVTFSRRYIENDYYIILGVDNYYESMRRDVYLKKHQGHSILLYGTSHVTGAFYMLEQPFSHSPNYKSYQISFDTARKCYESYVHKMNDSNFFEFGLASICRINNSTIPSLCLIEKKKNTQVEKDKSARNKYIRRMITNQELIRDSLSCISMFSDNIENLYVQSTNNKQTNEEIIKGMNQIIIAKNIELYLSRISLSYENEMEYFLKEIISDFTSLRSYFAKLLYSQCFIKEHVALAIRKLSNIRKLEQKLHRSLYKSIERNEWLNGL